MNHDVEIFWNGRAYDFDGNLKLPFEILHDAWRQADAQGLRVVSVKGTDNGHAPRPFVPAPAGKDAEERYDNYLRAGKLSAPAINVKK